MSVQRCPGPVHRREFLQLGSLALGGLSLSEVLAQRGANRAAAGETSVILLYCHGGPSQLETYDLKPDAPQEYRSVFAPISTSVPGMEICELFPLQAKIADRFSLVRSLHHEMSSHSDGGIEVLTGKTPVKPDPTSTSKSDHPDLGSVASRIRGMNTRAIPPYVAIPNRLYMTLPQYVGSHHAAFEVGDPSGSSYRPPQLNVVAGRNDNALEDRRSLLNQLDTYRRSADQHGALMASDRFRELAFQMLTSPETAAAFDLTTEDPKLRDRYGRNIWGQGCLLARRLAEAGSAVISLYVDTPKSGNEFTNWDDHVMNAGRPGHFGGYMRTRLPYLDQSLSALIEDIFDRGLDRRIMVVVMGEFGRTPRLSHNSQGTGRDHWPQAYTALVSGGGLRMGQVVGATSSKAEYPTERPYTPKDMLATIYRHLGIDRTQSFSDYNGRPIPILNEGEPIRELI
ncbi:MAG: DUF1501 domain-containing protein [Planctomycetaceae bacterium]|nr:DUF1501 domain-containing protein [Planctomycetaceae bacterium]